MEQQPLRPAAGPSTPSETCRTASTRLSLSNCRRHLWFLYPTVGSFRQRLRTEFRNRERNAWLHSCFDRTMEAELSPKWNGSHSVPLLFNPCATPAAVPYNTSSFGAFSFPDSSNKLSETCRTASTRLSLSRDHAAMCGEAPTLVVLVARRSSSDLRRWSQSEVQIEAEHEPSCTRRLRIPVVMLDSWRGEGGNDGDDLDQAGLGLRNTDADRMSKTNQHGRNRDSMWHNKNYLNSLVDNTTILHILFYIYIIDYPFVFFLLFSVPSMHL